MRKFAKEFKEFISKGNVLDMSVAVIIGGAFGKIVTSLVNDIIMPMVGWITGGINVSALKVVISPAILNADGTVQKAEAALCYGSFMQTTLDFLIISFCIFVVLKIVLGVQNKFKRKEKEEQIEEAAAVESTDDILRDIRLLLQEKSSVEQDEQK